jgi:hypothetical protein
MLATLFAEGYAPCISQKPAVLFSWLSENNRSLAGREGVEITFDACGIDKQVPAGASNREQVVGMRDQAATGAALKRLRTISPCSISRVMVHAHSFPKLR